MRIHLRGRNVGMAENGLHGAQVGPVFDHVRGAAVAQHVWAGMTACAPRGELDHLPYPLAS